MGRKAIGSNVGNVKAHSNDGSTQYYNRDRKTQNTSTTYLSDGTGPPIREEDVSYRPEVYVIPEEDLAGIRGRGSSQKKWDWALMERIYVEGIITDEGSRRWPTLKEIQAWSGVTEGVMRNRAARDNWTDKRTIHEKRIPAYIEAAAARHVGERMGTYLAAADEAVARRGAVEWLQEVSGEYLPKLMDRLKGKDMTCPDCGAFLKGVPLVNHSVNDALALIKMMMTAEGMSQQRLVIVSAVQWNINAQRDATIRALNEALARAMITDAQLTGLLELIGVHVGAVRWRYRVDPSEMAIVDVTPPRG